ncbi:MAG TPA: hypothetical protein VGK94_08810 [Candidatus Polarisedimenticolia bacterium]|jgi:uncharacterized membrane protein
MNPAHVHLILNHVPVVATGIGLLVLGAAMLRGNPVLTRAAFWIFVLAAVAAIPTYLTGEPAEEIVEHLAGVSEAAIHEHEEAARITMPSMMLLGLTSSLGLFLMSRRSAVPRWLQVMVLALGLVTFILMARTANLGGMVHHFEIRDGSAQPEAGSGSGGL